MHSTFQQVAPALIAHRGVTSRGYENSMAAFLAAVDNPDHHYLGIELDVHNTLDGWIVVHHDPVLASGHRIDRLSLDEVRANRLPDGSAIPILDEVMALPGGMRLFIEAKGIAPAWEAALIAAIRADREPARCQVHGFDHRVVARIGSVAPEITTGVLSASYPLDPVGPVLAAGARLLWQQWELIDADLIAVCRAHSIGVVAWTVPDQDTAYRLAELGVSASCIDS